MLVGDFAHDLTLIGVTARIFFLTFRPRFAYMQDQKEKQQVHLSIGPSKLTELRLFLIAG